MSNAWDDLVALEANAQPEAAWPVDLQIPTTEESPQEALPDWPEPLSATTEEADRLLPFQVLKLDDATVRVVISTVDSQLPTGFTVGDDPPFELTVSGNGYVYAEITYSTSSGLVTGSEIKAGASVPASSSGLAYVTLATYATAASVLTVSPNTAYGPITVFSCRNWYEPTPTFTVSAFPASTFSV